MRPVQRMLSIATTMALLSCGGSSKDVRDPLPFNPVADQFKVNAINVGSITVNPFVRNAVLMGMQDVNEAGGVLGQEFNVVAFIGEDAEDSAGLAHAMLDEDIKVINVSFSSRSLAVAEVTIPAGIPIISDSATSTVLTDLDDNDLYFRLIPSDIHQARVLAQVAINAGKSRAVSVYNATDAYGDTLTAEYKRNFELLGGEALARVAVPFEQTSGFDDFLIELEALNPDVVLNSILDAGFAANFENELAFFDIDALTLVPDTAAGVQAFINSIANVDSVDGALGTSPGFGLATNPEMIFFRERYIETFGLPPEGFNVNAYDFALVTALAIEHAGRENGTDNPTGLMIRDSLRAVMNPPGDVIGPTNLAEGLRLIKNGGEVDYTGGYGATDWDSNGDIVGEITYDIFRLDAASSQWVTERQEQIFIPLE